MPETSQETKFLSLQWAPNDDHVTCTVEDANEELDAPASLQVCRICLAFDVKMYHITDYKLSKYFQQITGILIHPDDRLPKMLCWECVGRLTSANKFRDKALRSHSLLSRKVNMKTYMTMRDVKSINRIFNRLQSTLSMEFFECDDSNLTIHTDEDVKSEWEVEYLEHDFTDDNEEEITRDLVLQVKDLYDEERDGNESDDDGLNVIKRKSKVKYKKTVDDDSQSVTTRSRLKGPTVRRKRSVDNEIVQAGSSTRTDKPRLLPAYRNKSSPGAAGGLDETLFTITALTQAEQVAEVQRRRDSHAYRTARYRCTVCYKVFHSQTSYDEHAFKHSDRYGAFECSICRIRAKTARILRKHFTNCHTRRFSCNKCPFTTRNRCVATGHQKYHTGVTYQCPHCHRQFDKSTTYFGHIRLKHVSRFVCELCGYAFINQRGIDVHKFKKHKLLAGNVELTGPYCAECDVRFVSEEAHARHLQMSAVHSTDNDREGRINDLYFAERADERMQKTDTNKKYRTVSCEQCGEILADYRSYLQHFLRMHPGVNSTKYIRHASRMCEQCGKIFKNSVNLRSHMWVHTGEKPFKCAHCDKTFTTKTVLDLHVKRHTGEQPTFMCHICGKHFTFDYNRSRHMLIHTGLKPFQCETCGKCFKTTTEQRSHVAHVHLKIPWPKRTRVRPPAPPRDHV